MSVQAQELDPSSSGGSVILWLYNHVQPLPVSLIPCLSVLSDVHTKHPFPSGLRTSSSSPNFWTVEPVCAQSRQAGQCGLSLPHSWSTGRLHVMLLSSAGWSHALGARTVPLELRGWEPQQCWQ